MRDWVGNASVRNTNIRHLDSEPNDYYATEPRAVELLLEQEAFTDVIWEPACGEGHISEVLKANGHDVISSDLIDRGYGDAVGVDFLSSAGLPCRSRYDIVTNPPYRYAKEFVLKALELVNDGRKVAMFLKLTFLEGQARRELFKRYPPKTIYVSSARLQCGKNGCFDGSSMVAYCWIVWEKGYTGPSEVKWIN